MAAHISKPARRDVSCSCRAGRVHPTARRHGQRPGLECPNRAMDAESGGKVEHCRLQICYFRFSICNLKSEIRNDLSMTQAELQKHLDAAEKSPKQIAAAVSGLPDKTLRYKPSPDKWCIHEILAHLADAEIIYAHLFGQMLADKKPVIAPIDQDDWARNLGYMETPPAELVALYGLNRHAN